MLHWLKGAPDDYGQLWFGAGAMVTMAVLYLAFVVACVVEVYREIK